jgi:hypothetical protein
MHLSRRSKDPRPSRTPLEQGFPTLTRGASHPGLLNPIVRIPIGQIRLDEHFLFSATGAWASRLVQVYSVTAICVALYAQNEGSYGQQWGDVLHKGRLLAGNMAHDRNGQDVDWVARVRAPGNHDE